MIQFVRIFCPFQDVEYLCILALDQPQQNLSQYFAQCNDFIHSARIQGGNVLIHWYVSVFFFSITFILLYFLLSLFSSDLSEDIRQFVTFFLLECEPLQWIEHYAWSTNLEWRRSCIGIWTHRVMCVREWVSEGSFDR